MSEKEFELMNVDKEIMKIILGAIFYVTIGFIIGVVFCYFFFNAYINSVLEFAKTECMNVTGVFVG